MIGAPVVLLVWSCSTAAVPQIAVLPLKGSASEADRDQGTEILVDTLKGFEGLKVYAIISIADAIGEDAQAKLDACAEDDDRCLVEATSFFKYDGLVAGAFDVAGGRSSVRLRLIATSTKGLTNTRVSRDVGEGGGEIAFRSAIASAANELFPEQAKKSFGTLIVRGGVEGALLIVDGVPTTTLRDEDTAIRLRPGRHAIAAVAPGRKRFEGIADVVVGQKSAFAIDLEKNRSKAPLVLGGIGVAAGGTALALGLIAQHIQHNWESACPMGQRCAAGFTRARYDSDMSAINTDKLSANGLFLVSAVALAAAVVWFFVDPGSDAR